MTIEEIVNGNYKVTEKQKMLKELRKQFLNKIDKAKEDIIKGYKYCPKCNEYYKEKAWETEYRIERRNVCTFHSLSAFEDDRWKNKDCHITYGICPVGHKIEENIHW